MSAVRIAERSSEVLMMLSWAQTNSTISKRLEFAAPHPLDSRLHITMSPQSNLQTDNFNDLWQHTTHYWLLSCLAELLSRIQLVASFWEAGKSVCGSPISGFGWWYRGSVLVEHNNVLPWFNMYKDTKKTRGRWRHILRCNCCLFSLYFLKGHNLSCRLSVAGCHLKSAQIETEEPEST